MLRTTTHPVTSAHYASFRPDVGKCDVCIVFDFRRYQRDVFELTMHAHARGAKILGIPTPGSRRKPRSPIWFSP